MKKRDHEVKYLLPFPSMTNVRDMVAGENRLFAAGDRTPSGPFEGASRGTSAILRTGGEATQRMMLLVDPRTCETVPVILLHCVKPGNPIKKRGRKPKGPTMLERLEALCRTVSRMDDNGPAPNVFNAKQEAEALIAKFFTPEGGVR